MIDSLALVWLVYATMFSVSYTGPFPTRAICEAAKQEAMKIEPLAYDCVSGYQYGDYLDDEQRRLESYGEYGGPY